ncbi:hypothetical protein B7494_g8316 [Chlorociboria aeruginascens]|nr:hypothetical protein B7494_g8316 [Chlorociboria aeruginascens]
MDVTVLNPLPSGPTFTEPPLHHRQNRRRERPGSRARRSISRRANLQSEYAEGVLDARDSTVSLPSDKSKPSPLLRLNFTASWQRWKAREAEERAMMEMKQLQLENEQRRFFGGDVDDDELYRRGILYHDSDTASDSDNANSITLEIPSSPGPQFSIRRSKNRRSRRRPTQPNTLPLYLSLSTLSHDIITAPFIYDSAIQHRALSTPISIPVPNAFSNSALINPDTSQSLPLPTPSLPSLITINEDWTFIHTPTYPISTPISHTAPSRPTSPLSTPETWILLSDDS